MSSDDATHDWQHFNIKELRQKVTGGQPRIHEFLSRSSMSCMVYHLPAGCRDLQAPHAEDEVYLVLEGRARLKVGDDTHEIGPDSLLFVRATTAHSMP